VPTFRRWIASQKREPRILVEPFTGGGIISLTALFENLAERVVMVELDDAVAAVWEPIISGDAAWLSDRVLHFQMSREAVLEEHQQTPGTTRERAFQTILKNRTLHGGILAEGSSFIRHGENGKGIGSRWYPETLAKRLMNLSQVAERIDFRHEDGLQVMAEFSQVNDAVFFIDIQQHQHAQPWRGLHLYHLAHQRRPTHQQRRAVGRTARRHQLHRANHAQPTGGRRCWRGAALTRLWPDDHLNKPATDFGALSSLNVDGSRGWCTDHEHGNLEQPAALSIAH